MASPGISIFHLHGRPQTGNVLRQIVRYIHELDLKKGSILPSQEKLAQIFKSNHNTINAAMKALTTSRVLTRKPGLGTVLLDPKCRVRGLWRVALALVPPVRSEIYYAQLLLLLQAQLYQEKIALYTYNLEHKDDDSADSLSHFVDLENDLKSGQIDLVLTMSSLPKSEWNYWSDRGIPFVHAGAWEDAPCGVIIDQGRMVREAVSHLVRRGCVRPAVVSQGGPVAGHERYWRGFVAAAEEFFLPCGQEQQLHAGFGAVGGFMLGKRLLEMPSDRRPDGLIVTNDLIAAGLTAMLVRQAEYRPLISVQTNRQASLAFAMPIIPFELDVNDLAQRATDLVLQRLFRPTSSPIRDWVHPILSLNSENYFN